MVKWCQKLFFKYRIDGKNIIYKKKQRLAKRVEPFPIKNGVMYKMGQNNKLKQCMLSTKAKVVIKELQEGTTTKHFATKITQKNFFNVGY